MQVLVARLIVLDDHDGGHGIEIEFRAAAVNAFSRRCGCLQRNAHVKPASRSVAGLLYQLPAERLCRDVCRGQARIDRICFTGPCVGLPGRHRLRCSRRGFPRQWRETADRKSEHTIVLACAHADAALAGMIDGMRDERGQQSVEHLPVRHGRAKSNRHGVGENQRPASEGGARLERFHLSADQSGQVHMLARLCCACAVTSGDIRFTAVPVHQRSCRLQSHRLIPYTQRILSSGISEMSVLCSVRACAEVEGRSATRRVCV